MPNIQINRTLERKQQKQRTYAEKFLNLQPEAQKTELMNILKCKEDELIPRLKGWPKF